MYYARSTIVEILRPREVAPIAFAVTDFATSAVDANKRDIGRSSRCTV
jgi:hypothetical protein